MQENQNNGESQQGDAPKVNVSITEIADKLFNISEDDLKKVIEEKGTEFNPTKFLENKFVDHLNTVKSSDKERIGKAVRETAERKEKEFYQGLGLEYKGQTGDEYYKAIKDHFSKSDVNEDYKSLQEKYNQTIKEKSELLQSFDSEKEKIIQEITSKYEKKEKVNKIKDIATTKYLSRKDLSWSEDKEVNQFRAKLFSEELTKLNTKFNEDGSIDLLDENGDLLKNDKHHVINFDDVATDILRKTIGISKQSSKSSTGIGSTESSASSSVSAPSSLKEFNEAYAKETDPVKKAELYKSFRENN